MSRLIAIALFGLAAHASAASAQLMSEQIISRDMAQRNGLERAWITRVQVDPAQGRVQAITHQNGVLFAQTSQGGVHAIDAETGRTLWVAYVGNSDHPTMRAGAGGPYRDEQGNISPGVVAVVNGSTLYLLNRDTGRINSSHRLTGPPNAGPAVTADLVYVPMTNGMVEAYSTTDLEKEPVVYQGAGRPDTQPLVTDNNVAWVTSGGNVYAADRERLQASFRFDTRRAIEAPLAYKAPLIFAASRDGYVYAVHERGGNSIWQFSTGSQIVREPVVIDDVVFVTPEERGMFAIDAATGRELWWNPVANEFLAASPTKVYSLSALGNLLVLDLKTGGVLNEIRLRGYDLSVPNLHTDRIYLATTTGLVLSLRERGLDQPVIHNQPSQATEAAPEDEPAAPAPAGEAPAPAREQPPADPDFDNPFG